MARKTRIKASWVVCDCCGYSETKINKSIHKRFLYCCKDYEIVDHKSLFLLNYEWSVDEINEYNSKELLNYGIAWAIEGDSPIQGRREA